MGSIEQSPKEFLKISCHIPTSSGPECRSKLPSSFRSVSIREGEHHLVSAGFNLYDAVIKSWAILLRKYTGSEHTSFITCHVPAFEVQYEGSIPGSKGIEPACHKTYCYVEDGALLRDIHVDQSVYYGGTDAVFGSANTAVWFSETQSTSSIDDTDRDFLPVDIQRSCMNNSALILVFWEGPEATQARLYYQVSEIRESYAMSVSYTFNEILDHLLSGQSSTSNQTDLPSPQDVQRMLSWNPTEPFKHETASCMHDLVALKVQEMPDAQAVCGWDGDLTYAELDKLSDSAATGLIEKGVKPGVFVPFAYEKSIYAVVAMLGILKAGAALVPLNPKDPLARLSDIVSSVKAEVVATTDAFASVFRPLVTHVTVISKKSLKVSVSKRDGLITVQPSDPMLVLFTSGSTGRPKGMLHTHASMTTHAVTHGTAMSYQNARVFQFAAYTFDVAIFDVFTTLLFGGCICVPSEADRSSNIVGAITSMQVNYAILTPSFAGLINPAEVPTLQTLAVGGEALPHDRIERWAEKVRLIQIYGPAEVAICLTVRMQADTPGAVVGYPLANSSCWLVDPDYTSRLVPIGAVGELVVAGPSLAVGYLNDEVRTRLSFIDAPLWASHLQLPFTRFYKTGDLLRYNLDSFDGSFIFLGRKDAQIKLRGQRIEPGEVELHIGRLPGVAFSMVIKPDKGCYQDQLIAVVQMASANGSSAQMVVEDIQLASNPTLTIDDVQRELKKVLPSYMVPIQCLVVRNMPFVPSLKIDRRRVLNWLTEMVSRPLVCSLATLDALGTDESTARCLSMYIAQLLAVNGQAAALEMHNFRLQDAGVDSIKLIALTMLVQKEYGITIPMDALVHPQTTIRNLAGWIDNHDSFAQPRAIDPFHESSLLSQGLLKQIEADSIAAAAATPHRVLLTGASGYLGSAIIHQLLQTPHTQVSALMRCDTPALGLQRLQTILSRKNCWHPQYAPRIRIWPGSLASPDLGLAPHHLAQLRGRASDLLFPSPQHPCRAVVGEEEEDAPPINAIIHAGATVHYTLPYNALYATNITSTLLLLRLSARNPHLRTFTYISGGETPNVDSTSTSPAYLAALSRQANGYTLTKNIAERVVLGHAASTTARIRVIKPGYIIGSLTSGHDPNPADFIWRLVAACVQLRAFNRDDAHRWLYLDDADSVAARVVAATTDTNSTTSSGNIERVLTGLRVGEVWSAVERVYNGVLVFEQLDAGEWGRRARAKAEEQGGMGSMSAVVHLLEREEGGRVGVDGGDATVVAEEGKEEEGRRVEGLVEGNLRALMRMGVLPMVDVGLG